MVRLYFYPLGDSYLLVAALAHVFGISLATSSWALLTRAHFVASMHENWVLLCIIVVSYVPLVLLGILGWQRRKVIVELHDPAGRRAYRV